MSKVYLVETASAIGYRHLVGDGKLLRFNVQGICLGEFPISYDFTSMQEVDVISVLVANNNVELGYNTGQQFSKKTTLLGLSDIARKISSLSGLIFVGKKDGVADGVTYSQYIYTFLKGSVPSDINL